MGEFAIYLALQRGLKGVDTTPIKALSNQKYSELAAKYGAAQVGLLTGDTSINGDAPVAAMTTEVLRNMLYADSDTLDDLRLSSSWTRSTTSQTASAARCGGKLRSTCPARSRWHR